MNFKEEIQQGIPTELPAFKGIDSSVSHAPKRKDILSEEEKKLALKNALRYFDAKHHQVLIQEFKNELETYGRVYMYRFRPDYKIYARPIDEYPGKSIQAKSIMLMIQNNLDYAIAQHPHELITKLLLNHITLRTTNNNCDSKTISPTSGWNYLRGKFTPRDKTIAVVSMFSNF